VRSTQNHTQFTIHYDTLHDLGFPSLVYDFSTKLLPRQISKIISTVISISHECFVIQQTGYETISAHFASFHFSSVLSLCIRSYGPSGQQMTAGGGVACSKTTQSCDDVVSSGVTSLSGQFGHSSVVIHRPLFSERQLNLASGALL